MSILQRFERFEIPKLGVNGLYHPVTFLVLGLVGVLLGFILPRMGLTLGALLFGGMVGLPMVLLCMFNRQFGIAFMMLIAFFVSFLSKINDLPFGTSLDGLLLLMSVGILIGAAVRRDGTMTKSPISTLVILWIYFNLLQGLNPAAESRMAWVFTVRSVAVLNILYFVSLNAFTSLSKIKFMLGWVIGLGFVACLYGYWQEFNGFSVAEKAWLYSDKERFQLFFQWGRLRVFSLFSDPMTFGVMMSYMALFCLIWATAPMKIGWRVLLITMGIMMLFVTAYTGTRTCYVLIPIGIFYWVVMKLSPKVMIGFALFLLIGAVFIFKSSSNPIIYRIQSAFRPSNDASVQIRYYNQKRIRPFIYAHPIGAGLGSTGLWARRFTPNSFLAHFAHDSYYVRLAVEAGPIGLILYMCLLGTVICKAIYYYLRVKDPTIKALYLALTVSLFMLAVANYPQEAIVQLPTSMVSYILFAAVVKLKEFDPYIKEMEAKE